MNCKHRHVLHSDGKMENFMHLLQLTNEPDGCPIRCAFIVHVVSASARSSIALLYPCERAAYFAVSWKQLFRGWAGFSYFPRCLKVHSNIEHRCSSSETYEHCVVSLHFRFHVQTSFNSHNVDWHKRISPHNFERILRNIFVFELVHSFGWLIHPPFMIVTHALCCRCCVTRWDANGDEQGHNALYKTIEHPDIVSIVNVLAYLTLELFTFYPNPSPQRDRQLFDFRTTDSSEQLWLCAHVLRKVQSEKPGAIFFPYTNHPYLCSACVHERYSWLSCIQRIQGTRSRTFRVIATANAKQTGMHMCSSVSVRAERFPSATWFVRCMSAENRQGRMRTRNSSG